jgi:hypothetical protein
LRVSLHAASAEKEQRGESTGVRLALVAGVLRVSEAGRILSRLRSLKLDHRTIRAAATGLHPAEFAGRAEVVGADA